MRDSITEYSICRPDGRFTGTGGQEVPRTFRKLGVTQITGETGRWMQTGPNTYMLTFRAALCDREGVVKGYKHVEGFLQVSESGTTLQATARSEFLDANNTVVASFPVQVEGKKLETASRLTGIRQGPSVKQGPQCVAHNRRRAPAA